MSRKARSTIALAALAALAGAVRVGYLAVYAARDPLYDHLLHDAKRYHEWGTAIASGTAWEPGPFHQAPLYPYLVALVYRITGPHVLAVYLLQAVLGIATVLLAWRIGARFRDARAGLAAAALLTFHGVLVFYETKLLPATLSVFLIALAVERLQAADSSRSDRGWLAAGITAGLGALANPGSLFLLLLATLWAFLDGSRTVGRRFRRAGLLVTGAALVILPVTIRNLRVGGEAVLISTNAGITFYQGNNPAAEGYFSAPDGFSGSVFRQREESRALAEREAGRPLRDAEVSSFWLRKGIAFRVAHPGQTLWLLARKLALSVGSYEQPLEYHPALDPNPVRWLAPLPFAVLLALAALFFLLEGPRLSRAATPPLLAIAGQLLVLLVFYVSSRYRLPAIPALAVFGGAGAVAAWDRLRSEPRKAVLPILTALVLCAISLHASPSRRGSLEAQGLCDRAGAYVSAGRTPEAVDLYREAIRRDPNYAFARIDLGHALDATGRKQDALLAFREAVRIEPALAEARLALGVHLYEDARFAEAADEFAQAFHLVPSSDAGNNWIGACLEAGRTAQAIAAWREMKRLGLVVDPPLESRVDSLGRSEP